MSGVFIVLAGGIVVSIVFLMVERRCNNLKEQVKNSGVRDIIWNHYYFRKIL